MLALFIILGLSWVTHIFPDDNELYNLFNFSVFNDASLVQFLHRNLAYIILFLYLIIFIENL